MSSPTRLLIVALISLAAQLPSAAQTSITGSSGERVSTSWINTPMLSPDGTWLAYVLSKGDGNSEVIARSVKGKTERRYPIGSESSGAGALQLSPSGRWMTFLTAGNQAKREGTLTNAALVDLNTGKREDFNAIKRVDLVRASDEWLVLSGFTSADGTFDLRVRSLSGASELRVSGLTAFALNKHRARLALAGADGVSIQELGSKHRRLIVPPGPGKYVQLTWSERGNSLAALRDVAGEIGLDLIRDVDGDSPTRLSLQAEVSVDDLNFRLAGLPGQSIVWREDEYGVFFKVVPVVDPPKAVAETQRVANLAIWHWQDERLPVTRGWLGDTPSTEWVYFESGKIIRLAPNALQGVQPQLRGDYVLGYDVTPYGWNNDALTGAPAQLRDYYLISLRSGKVTSFARKLRTIVRPMLSIPPQFSPDGSIILYQNNEGHYVVHDVAHGVDRIITAGLPTRFYLDDNDPSLGQPIRDDFGLHGPRLQGWTSDGAHVLISDFFDVWALPLKGGEAVNLTRRGRSDDISFWRVDLTRISGRASSVTDAIVDLGATLYFDSFDHETGRRGLFRRKPGGELEELRSEFADIEYLKAERAETFVMSRVSANEPREIYRTGPNFEPTLRLTDSRAGRRATVLSPGRAMYLSYENRVGGKRRAALYLPAGYVEGKAYPAIVEVYTGFSGGIHGYKDANNYLQPYLRSGYAVLQPDIHPFLGEAGRSAVRDVEAAVEAAVATGSVDRDRIGLYGHSFGAFETSFIITQTNLFKAAVSFAGMANLWSHCGSVYGAVGPTSAVCEFNQPYLGGPWWEKWPDYVQNSPLYHARQIETPLLLVHGDADTAVNFSQSVELFNTLRRLGGKPVVLLQYKGAGHNFRQGTPEAIDSGLRELQFFNHFLKGDPAPAWWADGLSYAAGQALKP